jgi:hypothetical protein
MREHPRFYCAVFSLMTYCLGLQSWHYPKPEIVESAMIHIAGPDRTPHFSH